MRTQWTITRDYIAEPGAEAGTYLNAVGLIGPRGACMTAAEIINHPDALAFQLYDDDGCLIYEGAIVGPDLCRPLDDFGTPNAGCTYMRVLDGATWTTV